MFWGIITSALSAINTIIYKKVLVLSTKNNITPLGIYACMCLLVVIMISILYMVHPASIDFHAAYSAPLLV